MSVVLLRTLTGKSKLGFGKFAQIEISVLIKRMRPYLVWVYYNSSNITFTPEILKELDIFEDKLIQKPGKNPELYSETSARVTRTLYAFKRDSHHNKEVKTAKKLHQKRRESIWFNKGANAWKNQGH